ncbi:3'-5' exonuclease [Devosia sp. BSSL-BM10]|uniref:3'-5' exonuclease n=1 Tax=Devosia litorisediminis TaxID=2829817 RepID=A0A942E8H6_9HYPH|nr:3'-5' exonuclease [Devosia litorisediminis]MBS3850213.1 3'-5' exonuclease [Devosia litorisediminis]
MKNADDDLEELARRLDASGDFRVLRRLRLGDRIEPSDGSRVRTGMFLDVETTGLDFQTSEILELAIVPFEYAVDGRIVSVGQSLHQFNEPAKPIPSEITAITGLTDELVEGHQLDITEIEKLVSSADILIAHNAGFDRPFVERISPIFEAKPWACTMFDVPWKQEGVEGRRLSDLLSGFQCFFDAHRAVDDCEAGIALLTMKLPKSSERVLSKVLKSARQPMWRIFAEAAPFESKDILKHRGYKWNSDDKLGPRAWWTDLTADRVDAEVEFLRSEIFRSPVQLPMFEITAFQRYSMRLR